MEAHLLVYLQATFLIQLGLVGTVLPVLPGLPVMFAGMLLVAWVDDFRMVSALTIIVLGALTALSLAVDFLATLLGVKRVGASKKAMLGATLGSLVGLWFGIAGLMLGPFLGAVVGEISDGRKWQQASKVGFGAWLGLALGAALKLGLAVAMLGIFAVALWVD